MTPSSGNHDHAGDLSWIVGTVQRVNLEGGFWELVFGAADAPLGGRVVLGRPTALDGVAEGSLVRVTGRATPGAMSVFMAGPTYEVDELEVIRRQ